MLAKSNQSLEQMGEQIVVVGARASDKKRTTVMTLDGGVGENPVRLPGDVWPCPDQRPVCGNLGTSALLGTGKQCCPSVCSIEADTIITR